MKLFKNTQDGPRRGTIGGFTLPEVMVTVGVFLFLFTGAWIAIQVFGLRVYSLAATKLVATAGGREALNIIRDQIRQAKTVYVGNCTTAQYSSFKYITNNTSQQGNALIVFPTTNANNCTIFYLDTSTPTNILYQFDTTNRAGVWANTYTQPLAKYITNQIVFDMRNWNNQIVSNEQVLDNRLLIEVTMQFSQWEYPIATIGGGVNAYDYYQLRTRVFRRAWN